MGPIESIHPRKTAAVADSSGRLRAISRRSVATHYPFNVDARPARSSDSYHSRHSPPTRRQDDQRQQRIVQLVLVANHRPGFFGHLRDRRRIERAQILRIFGRQTPAHLHRARAALLQRSIVQERVRVGVQQLMAEGRRLARIDGDGSERAFAHAVQDFLQSLQIHRLMQAVVDGFLHQRMIGNPDFAGQIFRARDLIGKNAGEQIVRAHSLNGRRNLAAAGESRNRQGTRGVPFPARAEHRRVEHGLRQHVLHRRRLQEAEHQIQRERMLIAQREHDPVVGGCGLQLEIESAAEAFAKRQSPGFVDPGPERRVDHQLHASGFVEEALGDHACPASASRPARFARRERIQRPVRRRARRDRNRRRQA